MLAISGPTCTALYWPLSTGLLLFVVVSFNNSVQVAAAAAAAAAEAVNESSTDGSDGADGRISTARRPLCVVWTSSERRCHVATDFVDVSTDVRWARRVRRRITTSLPARDRRPVKSLHFITACMPNS